MCGVAGLHSATQHCHSVGSVWVTLYTRGTMLGVELLEVDKS